MSKAKDAWDTINEGGEGYKPSPKSSKYSRFQIEMDIRDKQSAIKDALDIAAQKTSIGNDFDADVYIAKAERLKKDVSVLTDMLNSAE